MITLILALIDAFGTDNFTGLYLLTFMVDLAIVQGWTVK